MRTISLSQGKTTMVDDLDYEYLIQFSWHSLKRKHTCYACHGKRVNGKMKHILMHRLILKTPKGMESDHIDGNGLNNQRSNLRIATVSQNRGNHVRKCASGTSRFKGVSWNAKGNRWVANIQVNKKYMHLGSHSSELEAAKAYDSAAIEHFKEFASPNFK